MPLGARVADCAIALSMRSLLAVCSCGALPTKAGFLETPEEKGSGGPPLRPEEASLPAAKTEETDADK